MHFTQRAWAQAFSERVKSAISGATRETDLIGWYEEGRILAVIFAELNVEENVPVAELLRSKIETVSAGFVGHKSCSEDCHHNSHLSGELESERNRASGRSEALSGSLTRRRRRSECRS